MDPLPKRFREPYLRDAPEAPEEKDEPAPARGTRLPDLYGVDDPDDLVAEKNRRRRSLIISGLLAWIVLMLILLATT